MRIQNIVERLRWSFFQKYLTGFKLQLFSQTAAFYTTFTLEPTITDLKLIWICFMTSSNNIYAFSTVYTRKRINLCYQFSRLHLSMIMTGAR